MRLGRAAVARQGDPEDGYTTARYAHAGSMTIRLYGPGCESIPAHPISFMVNDNGHITAWDQRFIATQNCTVVGYGVTLPTGEPWMWAYITPSVSVEAGGVITVVGIRASVDFAWKRDHRVSEWFPVRLLEP